MIDHLRHLSIRNILALTVLLSLVITLWQYVTDEIVSRDGVTYLETALAYSQGGLRAAFEVYRWPLYPILFATLHDITGYEPELLAYALNAVLQALACVYFVRIYTLIDQDSRNWWIAALVILTLPYLNEYRADVMRGYGYWAFSLMFVYHYLRFMTRPNLQDSILFQVGAFLAVGFRPEGLVVALSGILPVLFKKGMTFSSRCASLLKLYFIGLLVGLALVLSALLSPDTLARLRDHTPGQAIFLSLDGLLTNFELSVENLKTHVLIRKYSHEHAALILSSGILTMLLWKVLVYLNIPYVAINVYYASQKQWSINDSGRLIVYFILINLLILLVFLFSKLFITSRYATLLVLLTTTLLTLGIATLINEVVSQSQRHWKVLLGAGILCQFLFGVVSTSATKLPMKQAGQHFSQSVHSSGVLCNEARLRYYSGFQCDHLEYDQLARYFRVAQENDYEHLMLWVKDRQQNAYKRLAERYDMVLVGTWSNKDGDTAVILERKGG